MESAAEQVAPAPSPPVIRRHTVWFLATYNLLCVVWGVRSVYHDQRSPLDWIVPVSIALALILWAFVDARRRGHHIPLLARPWFVLGYFVVVPGYIIWSRGWRGLFWLVVHAVSGVVVTNLAMHAFGLAVYGEQWLIAIGWIG